RLYDRSISWSFILLFPVVLLVVAFAREGLAVWLGESFAVHSTRVLQLLSIGILLHALAQPAFAIVQGLGRADLAAKLHLLELPLYLFTLYWAIRRYGINGAALVWTMRVGVDLIALYGIAQRLLPEAARIHRWAVTGVVAALAANAVYLFTLDLVVKIPLVV